MTINKLLSQYYQERKNTSKLFKKFDKKTISIHTVINQNESELTYSVKKFFMARSNDINLLRMVRKNEQNLEYYLYNMKLSDGHRRRYFNFRKWAKKISENKIIH